MLKILAPLFFAALAFVGVNPTAAQAQIAGLSPCTTSATLSASNVSSQAALSCAGGNLVKVWNTGTVEAFIAIGTSSVAATTSSDSLPGGACQVYSAASSQYISAITASGTATIRVTQGTGSPFICGNSGNSGGGISCANPGVSGGIPYYSSTTTCLSSGLLAANALMIGGGAGASPATTTTATGILTFIGTPSSANLAAAVTDETGSGALVFAASPTFTGTVLAANITASGNVGIGTTSPAGKLEVQDTNAIVSSTGTGGFGAFLAKGSGTNNAYLFFYNATNGEQSRITSLDSGVLTFSNTNGAVERMQISAAGSVIVGTAAISTSATDGFLYIPTTAGTPTGVPTAQTGRIAMVYDTTNHQFWFYDSGWKQPKTPAAAAIITWQ